MTMIWDLTIGVFIALCSCKVSEAFQEANKYLIVSSPIVHQVGYILVNRGASPLPGGSQNMRVLIDSGLVYPQGIAVDNVRDVLFVADPQQNGLVAYDLEVKNGEELTASNKWVVVDGIECRWVAVDGVGNVFITDEINNRVLKLTAEAVATRQTQSASSAATLYDQENAGMSVASPGGVAADNFYVYWSNKENGLTGGVLLQGNEEPSSSSIRILGSNSPKVYGVCLGMNTIFFTDEMQNLYATRRASGDVVTVADTFVEARGCTHDGEGTIYVADKSLNAVFAVATNTPTSLIGASVSPIVNMQGAYGTAMFIDAATSLRHSTALLVAIVLACLRW